MYKLFFFFLLIVAPQLGCLQNMDNNKKCSALKTYPLTDYKSDLLQLTQIIKDNHPKLYEFIPSDSFELLVNNKLAELNDSTTIGEFVWSCRSVAASIGCGHTYLPYLGESIYLQDSLIFPLSTKYIGDRLFVIDPLINADKINAGVENNFHKWDSGK